MHKLGPFFNFFYNVLKDLKHSRLVAFRNVKLVTRFVDMVCKIKDHFVHGYNFVAPPIEMAVRTLSLMVRCQPLVIWLYKLPIYQQVTIDEYVQVMA